MATIFIHHHVQDRFAAEIIAGTLVDCGEVRLRPHYPHGEQRVIPERVGVDWHIVLWTPHGATHAAIFDLVETLSRWRAPLMVLTYDDSIAPQDLRAENQFPLLDRAVEWTVYRAGLRRKLRYGEAIYPYELHERGRMAAVRRVERTVLDWLGGSWATPVLLLGGVLVWAMLR
jgi:hypothetical protein